MKSRTAALPRLKPLAACLALSLAAVAGSLPCTGSALAAERVAMMKASRVDAASHRQRMADLRDYRRALRGTAAPQARAPMPPHGTPLVVTSCADDGTPGTLRDVVATAASGDTVDLSQLACSTITLVSGDIEVHVDDLAFVGPGAAALTIDAGHNGRAFYHHSANTGTLTIADVTLANGYYFDDTFIAPGGCIYGGGAVTLDRVTVTGCEAVGIYSSGGGIYALGDVTLSDSTVSGNHAIGNAFKYDDQSQQDEPQPGGQGGGVYAVGSLSIVRSTISGNEARLENGAPVFNRGGGLFAYGPVSIVDSAIVGNVASGSLDEGYGGLGGGIFANFDGAALDIGNSTISGNSGDAGGAIVGWGPLDLANTTVAFNSASEIGLGGGGIVDLHEESSGTSVLNSSIVANNTGGTSYYGADFGATGLVVEGAGNLVIAASGATLPLDTLGADPLLLPLADNGGPTQTHALGSGSPAIDAGNNLRLLAFDQRGTPFVREANGRADIGAFETQGASDTLFKDGFDG